ncbi:phage holin family protein [Actinoallomurus rhizosphaericola]|uniref:phage holin family protein n=1 Tax=Actinoallomurus rhizosphaericola TaxID=2952536 RepID=UPI002092DF6C|nr:phage holin family protein [Actinoallomurus rhizosphaericola]MCO5996026.1 phage holin family protein [Actinoallomurus rhizosphaericola]
MSTTLHGPGTRRTTGNSSLGRLVSDTTADLQKLMRQEVALAKAEIRQEAKKAGEAAGLFGGAGFAGYMAVVIGSLAAMFGLAHVVDIAWAALIIAGIWAILGAIMAALGRQRMRRVSPPHRTVETLKEDAQLMRRSASHAKAIAAEPISSEPAELLVPHTEHSHR